MPPCVLSERNGLPDWCEEHQRYHHGHHRKFALGYDEVSEGYRRRWSGIGTERAKTAALWKTWKRSIPVADTCTNRGKLLDVTGCGCVAYSCKVHQTCSTTMKAGLTLCQNCDDFKAPDDSNAVPEAV